MAEMVQRFEPATLANIAGGSLETQFQTCMAEAADVFAEADHFECDKDGVVKVVVEMKVELLFREGILTAAAGADLKRPHRKKIGRALYMRGRDYFTRDEEQEMPLFARKPGEPAATPMGERRE